MGVSENAPEIKNTAIAIIAFDGYEDLWDDCIRFINKYWKKHPNIYFFTDELIKDWKNVTCIPVGKDAEWSRKTQKAVSVIKERYIILLLEDFYVGENINNDDVYQCIDFMEKYHIKYIKLCKNNAIIRKRKRRFLPNLPYEVIYADEEYGISLQPSIWDKDFLQQKIGTENYNAWVFEINEVRKSKSQAHCILPYAVFDSRNILHIKHGALQGKMLPGTVRYFRNKGETLSNHRKTMTIREYSMFLIKTLGSDLVPKFAVSTIKKIAKKFGYVSIQEKWS